MNPLKVKQAVLYYLNLKTLNTKGKTLAYFILHKHAGLKQANQTGWGDSLPVKTQSVLNRLKNDLVTIEQELLFR